MVLFFFLSSSQNAYNFISRSAKCFLDATKKEGCRIESVNRSYVVYGLRMTTTNRNVFICAFSPRPNENGLLASEWFFRGNFDLLLVHPDIYVCHGASGELVIVMHCYQIRSSQMLDFINNAVIKLVDAYHMLLYCFVVLMTQVCSQSLLTHNYPAS